MAQDQKVKVRIQAKDEASAEIQKVEKSSRGLGTFLKSNFAKVFGTVTVAVGAAVAALVKFGKEAYEQERGIKRLEAALKPLGSAARGVRNDLLNQAGALAKVTGESDTTIISMQALLAQMGVSAPKIAQAAQASVDLSAALGIDLTSAARNVGKTIGGFAGELGELIPELKSLSTEALQAGEGIDLLSEKFGGAAAAARTGGEAFGEFGNAVSDFGRNLVSVIANNEKVMELVDALADAIRQLTPEFEHNEDVLSSWRDVVIDTNDTLSLQVGAVRDWLESIGKSPRQIEDVIRSMITMTQAGYSVSEAFKAIVTSWERALEIQKQMDDATKSLETSLSTLGVKLSRTLNEELNKLDMLILKVTQQYRNGEISARDYEVAIDAIAKKQNELRIELDSSNTTLEESSRAMEQMGQSAAASVYGVDRMTQAVNRQTHALERQAAAARWSGQLLSAQQAWGTGSIGRHTGLPVGPSTRYTITYTGRTRLA